LVKASKLVGKFVAIYVYLFPYYTSIKFLIL